jgi:hypothetical protein
LIALFTQHCCGFFAALKSERVISPVEHPAKGGTNSGVVFAHAVFRDALNMYLGIGRSNHNHFSIFIFPAILFLCLEPAIERKSIALTFMRSGQILSAHR